jgi:hypothetical protein
MYFKEVCAEQNYPSLYEGAWGGWIIVLMAHAYLHESQQYTVCHPSLVKIQIIWVVRFYIL